MSHINLDLSHKLYALSGWNDTDDLLVKFSLSQEPIIVVNPKTDNPIFTTLSGEEEWKLPCYNASYLMRKLPAAKLVGDHMFYLTLACNAEEFESYSAGYQAYEIIRGKKVEVRVLMQVTANSPDDALGQLAVLMYDRKLLTKEEKA